MKGEGIHSVSIIGKIKFSHYIISDIECGGALIINENIEKVLPTWDSVDLVL